MQILEFKIKFERVTTGKETPRLLELKVLQELRKPQELKVSREHQGITQNGGTMEQLSLDYRSKDRFGTGDDLEIYHDEIIEIRNGRYFKQMVH